MMTNVKVQTFADERNLSKHEVSMVTNMGDPNRMVTNMGDPNGTVTNVAHRKVQ